MQPSALGTFASTGRFEPVAILGRGYSGLVYRVHDREMGVDVALKTLDTRDPDKLYRLKQEFRALADIHHTNLVELYELVAGPSDCFFTMEFVDGLQIIDHVRGAGAAAKPFSPVQAERFTAAALQLVRGVAALHAAGKLHRDIKPPNILVSRDDERVVVLDFGFAVALGPDFLVRSESGAVAGTLAYMAPEQLWGTEPAASSDWYSVGVVLYEILTGRLPFEGAAARALTNRPLPPSPRVLVHSVSESLDHVVMELLQPEPSRRPGADEILECLQHYGPQTRPIRPIDREQTPFVGRVAELARLQQAFDAASNGQLVIAHVHGSSGVGKSELIRQFLLKASADAETVVLTGRCHPQEAVPYKAFDGLVDSLSRLLNSIPDIDAAALTPRNSSALVQLFPVLERVAALAQRPARPADPEPREVRRRGFAAFRELLARMADRRRVVLWIDDVQWSDDDSAELAREILRPPDAPGVLLILSYRTEDRDRSEFLSATFAEQQSRQPDAPVREIEVLPLNPAEARELAARLSGVSEADVDSIVAEAEGSPFFVRQLARHLKAAALSAEIQGGQARLGLAAVLDGRMHELSAAARTLLEVAAVAGRPLDRSVALAAAGAGERARPVIRRLEQDRLLRSVPMSSGAGIEVYHDRIREMVLARLTPVALRALHGELAHNLSQQPAPDPEAVFEHLLGAGNRTQAAGWAVRAADRAAAALAFADAARLYGEALELERWDDARRAQLTVQRADAFVNAGRGSDAATLYLEASRISGNAAAVDLRRRAGEQFLISGHMDEGTGVMRQLLTDLDVSYPRSSRAVTARTLIRLAQLAARGFEPRTQPNPLSALTEMQIETCNSAAKGLALVDPFRGLYFAVETLLRALTAGDRWRTARALSGVGATLIPAGGPLGRWAGRMIERANEAARGYSDPYLQAYTSIMTAQRCMMRAQWKEMLELCDTGSELLRAQCRGVTWELDVGCMAAMRALEELGEIAELGRRAEQLLRDAESAGDLYGTVTALLMKGVAQLTQGNPEEARRMAQRAVALWTPGGFHMQHFYGFRLEAYCDVYAGRPADAWQRIEETWPAIKAASLLQHALLRTDAYVLRGRVALSLAQSVGARRSQMLRQVQSDARRLAREKRPDAVAQSQLLGAGLAASQANPDLARRFLEDAAQQFAAVGMKLGSALVSQCKAITDDHETATIGSSSETELYFRSQGINVERLLALYAPGFRDVRIGRSSAGLHPGQ